VDRQELFEEVVETIKALDSTVKPEEFRLDDKAFRSYGIDSLTLIRLAARLEDRYDIRISDADAFAASSFQRLVDLLLGKLMAAQSDPR